MRSHRESDFLCVIAGLDPAIHGEVALACLRRMISLDLSMDHRVKPGGDECGGTDVSLHAMTWVSRARIHGEYLLPQLPKFVSGAL
jgi:hypothetical protein